MANATSTQILMDGPRNVVVKFEGILDTSDLAATTILDPALLSAININGQLPTKLCIQKITYNIEDTLGVILSWDATTAVRIEELVGRGKMDYRHFGGIYPTAATIASAGFTGKLIATTQGWAASGILSFSVIIECTKMA